MLILLRCIVFIFLSVLPGLAQDIPIATAPQILLLNSYHKGYSWSDQVVDGIESNVLLHFPEANIRVEYMDTKRNISSSYMEKLSNVYQEKFSRQKFDLIFASDDNAINYLLENRENLFPEVPIVFCGANNIESQHDWKGKNVTGVLEYADIRQTVDIALRLQPDTRRLVVINDKTITGKSVGAELNRFLEKSGKRFEVTLLEDLPLSQLARKLSDQPDGSIVLLLAYLRDRDGVYYDPAHTAEVLSKASSVPIYSVWDFYFNHGIVGGVMTSGHLQGEAAAKLGLEILYGNSVENLPIGIEGGNQVVFDFNALQRFHLPVEKLPQEAIVKNIKYSKQKNVLILNSYSADNDWTRSIMSGLEQRFAAMGGTLNTFVEFMDTKRYSSSPYLFMLAKLLAHKYEQTKLDAIIVSDDNAYNFILHQRQALFKDVPLVFCGVNYLEDTGHLPDAKITGVVESYDILGTLELGLKLFPKTQKILVINDETTTGKSNHQRLTDVLPQLPENIEIDFAENTSMFALQRRLELLDEQTLVLLMSFTKDKNNHLFSYQQSVEMITQASVRPVLGFWDFYVGSGILGGVITSGYEQGEAAANLAMAILNGEDVSSLPVITQSPVRRILDYEVLQRFGLEDVNHPEDVVIFNRPPSLMDDYANLIYTVAGIIVLLVLLVATQSRKIFFQKKRQEVLAEKAETDPLTGAKNREFLMDFLGKQTEISATEMQPLVVCYFDLDNLKRVNDEEGHKAGDRYLLTVVEILQSHIRASDVLCRIGGDEFVLVLPRCTKEKIDELWSRINNDIQLKKQDGALSAVASISYGYAELDPYSPVSPEALIETADHNMYTHKISKKRRLSRV